jgi:transaldolase
MKIKGENNMSKLIELANVGQSIWYDYIRRSFITSGELQSLIDIGLRGITSNPSIFEKAIAGSNDYDEEIRKLADKNLTIDKIYEALVIRDIELAADLMMPVYESTNRLDGYVSIEVDPELANNTEATIREAKRLFSRINKPNIMIKIPATKAGLSAITEVTASGINVNITLIFSVDNYLQVADAYINGLELLNERGGALYKVSSVASFFVSRIDTAVDLELDWIGAHDLKGKIAVDNSKKAYHLFKEKFSGQRWHDLEKLGATVQRLLWASTGTKNPNYPDTLYVDELIGRWTVNTVPPATLQSYMDHGSLIPSIETGYDEAMAQMSRLKNLKVDLDFITNLLQEKGVEAFSIALRDLKETLRQKVDKIRSQSL